MAEVKLVNIKKIYPLSSEERKLIKEKQVIKKDGKNSNKGNLEMTEEGVVAVQDFNIDIKDKEFIVLVGPSGCGKSTTLRMIAGLEDISGGELYIDGKLVNDIDPKNRDIAMVFQSYALYPHLSVYENIAFPLKIAKVEKSEMDRRVREAAEILNLTDFLDRKPKNLSGGQRQRVAIGRAIVRNPKVLLMDEPLSNLDAKLRSEMRSEIIKLRKKINTTFIYVTHDQVEAMTLGDRIVVMKDGFVRQIGTPQEVFQHPIDLFVSGFIGTPTMNYFSGKLFIKDGFYFVSTNDYQVKLSEPKQARLKAKNVLPQDVVLGVRPDHLVLDTVGISARVNVSELMGTSSHLHMTIDDKDIIAIVPNNGNIIDYGDREVKISFSGEVVHIFSKESEKNLEF